MSSGQYWHCIMCVQYQYEIKEDSCLVVIRTSELNHTTPRDELINRRYSHVEHCTNYSFHCV